MRLERFEGAEKGSGCVFLTGSRKHCLCRRLLKKEFFRKRKFAALPLWGLPINFFL